MNRDTAFVCIVCCAIASGVFNLLASSAIIETITWRCDRMENEVVGTRLDLLELTERYGDKESAHDTSSR